MRTKKRFFYYRQKDQPGLEPGIFACALRCLDIRGLSPISLRPLIPEPKLIFNVQMNLELHFYLIILISSSFIFRSSVVAKQLNNQYPNASQRGSSRPFFKPNDSGEELGGMPNQKAPRNLLSDNSIGTWHWFSSSGALGNFSGTAVFNLY